LRFLLDSHAWLWWLMDDRRLGRQAAPAIADPSSLVFVSAATVWELAIKTGLGRLEIDDDVDLVAEIAAAGFYELPITARHARRAALLPRHHEDPFDRMLIAQAQDEGLTCVTRDAVFSEYPVATLW
jgi:PIN domain nuclease of toxin-antitoxin system